MDRRMATRLSKFLSLVLRHRPSEYGLNMDDEGFVAFDDLVDIVVAEDILAEDAEDEIMKIVDGSSRRRFEVVDGRIRALYGHSSGIRLNLPEHEAPEFLYHGTTLGGAREIAKNGLKPLGRAFVHLSATEEEALAVGRRHCDEPVIIRIDTAATREQGIPFSQATDLIWLCPALPPDVCEVPDLPDPPAESSPPAPARDRAASPPAPARDRGDSSPPAARPAVPPAEPSGFKRRTRKKSRRR